MSATIPKALAALVERAATMALHQAEARGDGNTYFFSDFRHLTAAARVEAILPALATRPFPRECESWPRQVRHLIVVLQSLAPRSHAPTEPRRINPGDYEWQWRESRTLRHDFVSSASFSRFMRMQDVGGCEPLSYAEMASLCDGKSEPAIDPAAAMGFY